MPPVLSILWPTLLWIGVVLCAGPKALPAQDRDDGIVNGPFQDLDNIQGTFQDDDDLDGEGSTDWFDLDGNEYDYDRYDASYGSEEPDDDDWFYDHYTGGHYMSPHPPGHDQPDSHVGRGAQPDRFTARRSQAVPAWDAQAGTAGPGGHFFRPPSLRWSGKVLRSKTVALRDSGRQHLVVLLRTDFGRRRIVDLGLVERFKDLEIVRGERLTVRGRPVIAGDMQILRADRIEADNQVVRHRYVRPPTFAPESGPQARSAARALDPNRWH